MTAENKQNLSDMRAFIRIAHENLLIHESEFDTWVVPCVEYLMTAVDDLTHAARLEAQTQFEEDMTAVYGSSWEKHMGSRAAHVLRQTRMLPAEIYLGLLQNRYEQKYGG